MMGFPAAIAAAFRAATLGWKLAATHLCPLFFQDCLTGKTDAVAFNREHFHQHLIAFFQLVANIFDAMLGNFADMQQAVGARNDFDKRTEIRQACDRSEVSLPYFGSRRQIADDLQRLVRRSFIVRSHIDLAGIFHIDLDAGLLDDRANHLAARPDDVSNLVDGNLQGVDTRSERRDLLACVR